MDSTPRITARSWLMVATLGFVWGGTFLVMEIALRGITPYWLAAFRIGFAALLLGGVWIARGGKLFDTPPDRATLAATLFVGTFSGAVPFILLAWGQQFVTSGFAGVSMAAVSLFVLPLAHFLVPGERLNLRKSAGFLLGFAGVCILVGAQAFEKTGAALETPGRLACLAAAACYAMSSILIRRLPPVDPFGLAAILMIIGTCVVIPAAFAVEGLPPMPDNNTLLILAFLGLIPTAGANLMRIFVVRSAGPVFMSLVGYQVPLWSVFLGALFLGEPLPGELVMAMVMILSGMALSQYGAFQRLFGSA
ncbi:MAG: DMT family transporter [Roseobacter sp.]|jgi:drug/metabolite transporter (DMT)-like permease|nr:DMT family transporter [Roseobacter sp.]